ncbi:MAG: sulfotransferase domain-containing protein [Verrucomicrobiae bacterium]|nr:sulfotransferase domain-containing protein [Verrucomicrobiae bacterium]MDW8343034.1 sulfotransferase [Verrucomicrobiae bacterium]
MLPNLVVIGAQKCGTTSLHFYLKQHPQIFMSRIKELNFFCLNGNWSRGLAWYQAQFSTKKPVRGESSPHYTSFPSESAVASRMHEVIPQARLIYLVRDPIQRIVSHYVHWVALGREMRPFEEAVGRPDCDYVYRSRYWWQLQQFLQWYPPEQILVVLSEDLKERRVETLQKIFRFLCVDDTFQSPRFSQERFRAGDQRKPTRLGSWMRRITGRLPESLLPPELHWRLTFLPYWPFSRPVPVPIVTETARERLRGWLADDVQALRKFLRRDLTEWALV